MTLRRRLVLAVGVLMVALVVAGLLILQVHRRTVLAQIDARVTSLTSDPARLAAATRIVPGAPLRSASDLPGGLTDLYVGRLTRDGHWQGSLSPFDDPTTHPTVRIGELLPRAVTRLVPGVGPVRVATTRLADGDLGVVAAPLDREELALGRLRALLLTTGAIILALLALLVWWVERLGLAPIGRMTRVADAISSGDREARVAAGDLTPAGTEAARLGSALNAMADATRAGERRMEAFVADASHELRTPLTTLRGYASLHRDQPGVPEATRDALQRIDAESARMARIVDDLLALTTLEEHGLGRRDVVDLSPIVRGLAADLEVIAPGHHVIHDVRDGLLVTGDRDGLTQALVALTSNAARHTPAGTTITITAASFDSAGAVIVCVSDDGPGIPPEHRALVLDRFHRVDGSRSATSGGTGLGLALAQAIAHAHGGALRVDESPSGGAQFTLVVPGAHQP